MLTFPSGQTLAALCFAMADLVGDLRCCVKQFLAVMSLQGAALINVKHSRYYLINTKLPLSGTKLRSFIEQFLYTPLCGGVVGPMHCISERRGEKSIPKAEFGNTCFCKPTILSALCTLVNPVNREHSGEEINWVNKNIQAAKHESESQCLQTTDT